MTNTHVQRMLDVIQNDYAGVVTLQRLSATIGRQPAYLGRLFRQEVGSSMREYLTRVRLEHAADLIRAGVKVEAVALIVGYRSKKNFYEQFKRRYGVTPAPYRHQSGIDASSGSALEHDAPREERITGCAPSRQIATAAEVPRRSSPPVEPAAAASSEPELEPVFGQVGSIIRASKKARRLAVRTQQILLAHFERTRVGLLLSDDRGRYIGANPAAMSVTGYSVPELHRLSQADLFPGAPHRDTRCVWQLVLSTIHRNDQSPNAVVRDKAGACTRVHLVTVKNMLWGRREMSALLERLPAATDDPIRQRQDSALIRDSCHAGKIRDDPRVVNSSALDPRLVRPASINSDSRPPRSGSVEVPAGTQLSADGGPAAGTDSSDRGIPTASLS